MKELLPAEPLGWRDRISGAPTVVPANTGGLSVWLLPPLRVLVTIAASHRPRGSRSGPRGILPEAPGKDESPHLAATITTNPRSSESCRPNGLRRLRNPASRQRPEEISQAFHTPGSAVSHHPHRVSGATASPITDAVPSAPRADPSFTDPPSANPCPASHKPHSPHSLSRLAARSPIEKRRKRDSSGCHAAQARG